MRSGVPVPSYNSRSGGAGAGVSGLTTADGGNAIADNEVIRGDGTTGIQGSVALLTDAGALSGVTSVVASTGYSIESGNETLNLNGANADFGSAGHVRFFSDPDIGSGAADAGLNRAAAGRLKVTNGGAGAGALDVGNLRLATSTLSSEDVNGHINLTPNGTGEVRVSSAILRINGGPGIERSGNFFALGSVATGPPLFGGNGGSGLTGALLSSTGETCWSSGGPTTTRASNDLGVSRSAAGVLSVDTVARDNGLGKIKFGGGRCLGLTSSTGAASTTEYPTDGDWGLHKNTTSGVTSLARNDGGVIKSVALA